MAAKRKKPAAASIRVHCVVVEVSNLDEASAGYAKLLGTPGTRIRHGGGRH